MKKTLRDAGLGIATVGLLLYAAMTAAKSMAAAMEPQTEPQQAALSCRSGAPADSCRPRYELARND